MSFDEIIDRRGSHCAKWDKMEALYGVPAEDGTLPPLRISIAFHRVQAYTSRRDTLPQRRAHICEDTSNGDDQTGNAAG